MIDRVTVGLLSDISSVIVDCYIELYRPAGLYILLCASPLAICQVTTFAAKLYTTWYLTYM